MGPAVAPLGADSQTPPNQIEQFLDRMFTKTHRYPPFVVLTAPFGQSTSPNAPYSTLTGEIAPGNKYATNTWRNNFGIQKGIGCPAEPGVINALLDNPMHRLACPHMVLDEEGRHTCGIEGAEYRGEDHAIWIRKSSDGYQVVDLNKPSVYEGYLLPSGRRIPIFPLMAVLYCFAPSDAYPVRPTVGIPDFAEDFRFTFEQVEELFDCDPDSTENAALLAATQGSLPIVVYVPEIEAEVAPVPLPELGPAVELNTGVGAELAVAAELQANQWNVLYRGNQRNLGYDLEATRETEILRVEVKSSVGFAQPELTESEWAAAQGFEDEFILAVVDFYGSDQQRIWYVRNPAATVYPVERQVTVYRLPRLDLMGVSTESEFL
jgi:hypothetical protein